MDVGEAHFAGASPGKMGWRVSQPGNFQSPLLRRITRPLTPLARVLAVDAALEIEQGIDPLHGLERDRVDHAGMLPAAFLASSAGDIG